MPTTTRLYLEQGRKRVFASALDWPGWARSGRSEGLAVDELLAYAERYAEVAVRAGRRFPAAHRVEVVERVPGTQTTDFGAPGVPSTLDAEPLTAAVRRQQVALMRASWTLLDAVVAAAPTTLRTGPRGGGRDRDEVVAHVLEAERAYARKLGVRHPPLRCDADVRALRDALATCVLSGSAEGAWPPAYAVRRITWHVLDHAWEIQDRSS